jgi:hypothetical protein
MDACVHISYVILMLACSNVCTEVRGVCKGKEQLYLTGELPVAAQTRPLELGMVWGAVALHSDTLTPQFLHKLCAVHGIFQ